MTLHGDGTSVINRIFDTFCAAQPLGRASRAEVATDVNSIFRAHGIISEAILENNQISPECRKCFETMEQWCLKAGKPCDLNGRKE